MITVLVVRHSNEVMMILLLFVITIITSDERAENPWPASPHPADDWCPRPAKDVNARCPLTSLPFPVLTKY